MVNKTPDRIVIEPVAPNWQGLVANLRREGTPERVYYFEHGVAENVQAALAGRYGLWDAIDRGAPDGDLLRSLAVHRFLGHELFRVFPSGGRLTAPRRQGQWVEEGRGAVTSWEDFEAFDWPDARDADLAVMERLEEIQPENMRAFHVFEVWEVVRDLFGYESFCFAMYEQPDLVEAVFEKVGGFTESIARAMCDFDTLGAVYISDDLGYKTGLMISPEQIRRFVLPWHKRLAQLAHDHGKLVLLHSCGDMYDMMDEYIEDVGIDAKHSFEDNVLPVTEVKKRYGDRLALLGGVDVDLLARADLETIRRHTRAVLDICQPGGGYCLGSGNWVTEYIPVDAYLAMLDEARRT